MTENQVAQKLIGECIRAFRTERSLTLEDLADKADITYQYLSGIENGKENFSISVLESIAKALEVPLKVLVSLSYSTEGRSGFPEVDVDFFRRSVPLPEGLRIHHLQKAMNHTQYVFYKINQNLIVEIGRSLNQFIQKNNFSGLVSNIFTDSLSMFSPYKHNGDQSYPDLINPLANNGESEGLEVKATIKIGKGGESHNGHSGWHTIICYEILDTGNIEFLHVMFANLKGHQQENSDWKYVGSSVNKATGSQRTETYNTNGQGTTKLRDGSVFLNSNKIKFNRWNQTRLNGQSVPRWSIFYK